MSYLTGHSNATNRPTRPNDKHPRLARKDGSITGSISNCREKRPRYIHAGLQRALPAKPAEDELLDAALETDHG